MGLHDKIRFARKNANLTQQHLADLIGVAKSTIAGYEKGDREPDAIKLKLIAKHTGVSGSFLLELEEKREQQPAYSSEAIALAKIYDELDSHGKQIVDVIARMEHERVNDDDLPEGVSVIKATRIPLIGEAVCDGTIEARQAAAYERSEIVMDTLDFLNK